MNRVQDFIKVYDNVFDEKYCKYLIKYINTGSPEFIDYDNRPKFQQIVFKKEMVQVCVDKINPFLDKYVNTVGCEEWLPEEYTYEYPRVKKYRKGTDDQFASHVDVTDYSSSRRFLSFLVYLNDVETGGETKFLGIGKHIRPKCGRMLVFPPVWTFPHQGNPSPLVDKYILSTYLHYL